MADKYNVLRFVGVPVEQDGSGNYQIKRDAHGEFKLHEWRIGKHTKGKFRQVGQVFLTENQMRVAILASFKVSFKKRHQYTPMARFLSDDVSPEVVSEASTKLLGEK
ncbi:DUF7671 family protein [Fructilactobacillus frigidiflavus]|uniref:DUF7671 family protein n=1 Tax=Fructilactobacillus frigidiflavus TaxID=3242688 RepID=UPI0037564EFC